MRLNLLDADVTLRGNFAMAEGLMERFLNSSHFSGGNAAYIEELYETYLHEPNNVPTSIRSVATIVNWAVEHFALVHVPIRLPPYRPS